MRSFRFVCLSCILCLFAGITFAAFSQESFIAQFDSTAATLSSSEQRTYYLKLYNSMSLLALRNRADADQYQLYTSLKDYIKSKITILTWASVPVISASGMDIPKVDLVRVREARLSLHNAERATKKLAPFTYNASLEKTATTRAKHLADIGKTTHKRKNTDGYYSYENIKQRFINQWIIFANKEQNGQAVFSESLGWNIYSCKKADCTDDFIKAIKKSRSFFMSEKPSGPHYNAIVGKFSNIWLWVALVGKKYYLVTHYTQILN